MHSTLLGCAFLFCTASTWVAASFLAQFLVSGPQPSLHPFLLCWICTSLFSLYLPIIALKQRLVSSREGPAGHETALLSNDLQPPGHIRHQALFPEHSRLGAALKVLPVACIWFLAQFTFTVSLANTSVTSNTILSSSSSMWTLLASALVLREHITCIKLLSVAGVMAGTAMVALADSHEAVDAGDRSLFGDALCVLSAMMYSCYTVTMQRQLKEDDPDVPALFFGYIGVLTAVLGLPVAVLLHVLGSVDLLGLDPRAIGLAVLNGLMDYCLGDYTWARAVLLLGSTVATLGTSLQIPVATVADIIIGHPHWVESKKAVWLTASGTVLIMAGVVGVNLSPYSLMRQRPVANSNSNDASANATDSSSRLPLLQDLEEQD